MTHFAYNEWPMGVAGAEDSALVPGSTHGILGLVEHALAHQEEASLTGPIAVHCRSVSHLCHCLTHYKYRQRLCHHHVTSLTNPQQSIQCLSVTFIHVCYISLNVKLNVQ